MANCKCLEAAAKVAEEAEHHDECCMSRAGGYSREHADENGWQCECGHAPLVSTILALSCECGGVDAVESGWAAAAWAQKLSDRAESRLKEERDAARAEAASLREALALAIRSVETVQRFEFAVGMMEQRLSLYASEALAAAEAVGVEAACGWKYEECEARIQAAIAALNHADGKCGGPGACGDCS